MATTYETIITRGNNIIDTYNRNPVILRYSEYSDDINYMGQSSSYFNTQVDNTITRSTRTHNTTYFDFLSKLKTDRKTIKNLIDLWSDRNIDQLTSVDPSQRYAEQKKAKTLEDIWTNDVRPWVLFGVDPGTRDVLETNKYVYTNDYKNQFDALATPVDPPDSIQINSAKRAGFILGQILGSETIQATSSDAFNDIYRAFSSGRMPYAAFIRVMDTLDTVVNQRNYRPGMNRIQEPVLRKYSLDQILQQNLLLPANNLTNTNTFNSLYTDNRSKTSFTNPDLKDSGAIAGVAVKYLREPFLKTDGTVDRSQREVHNFVQDNINLNTDKQDRGFIENRDVRFEIQNPAVINSQEDSTGHMILNVDGQQITVDTAQESATLSHNQFFPFMFETENHYGDGDLKQYCFFQAAISQINESFVPSWDSKNFFGRTEQVNTYIFTTRTIDLKFAIFASTARSLQNLYERVNWLAQQTYGSVKMDQNNVITRAKSGPIIRITIGDQWQRVPCIIQNLNLNWDFMGPGGKWELTKGLQMIQGVEVSTTLQVMHDRLPDRNFDFYVGLQPGITVNNQALIPVRNATGTAVAPQDETFVDFLRRKNS
jgi:hypothetical protein